MNRVYLDVPFAEKGAAKSLGARWDSSAKRWYIDGSTPLGPFAPWLVTPIADLPGEDRSFGGTALFVDLIPTSCWFVNVRSNVAARDWRRLARFVYERASYTCEVCGAKRIAGVPLWSSPGSTGRIDAHERWSYTEATGVQRLERLLALCQECHTATHFGLAVVRGIDNDARAHLARVNRWSAAQVERHIEDAWRTWERRDARLWALDLSVVLDAGIEIQRCPQ